MPKDQFVEQALRDFEGPLIGYAMGIVKDLETARDVVQDTFIKLYAQEPEKVEKSLKTWLYTVCRNRAFDILRKRKRIVDIEDEKFAHLQSDQPSPRRSADFRERMEELMTCLHLLSDNQREVILLKYQQGLSYVEISEITGLTTGNVGFLLHNGVKKLRTLVSADLLNQYESSAHAEAPVQDSHFL